MKDTRAVGFPSIYRQGPGLLDHIGEFVRAYGQNGMIVADTTVRSLFENRLVESCAHHGVALTAGSFSGESSPGQIANLVETTREKRCDFVIGMGGGKAQDAAKGVKNALDIPVIIIPTIASNDAATSRLAITYSDDGRFIGPTFLDTNPDAVLVDSAVIANAPIRYFIAGIGDALSTYFEAEQCRRSGALNFFGALPTRVSLTIAKACYETIRLAAPDAVNALKNHRRTSEVEDVIEANILMSGLGFEGCGVAAAHAIAQGFTLIDELHGNLHGEEVAVALLAQLVLEKRNDNYVLSMIDFYHQVGIPSSLAQLGLDDPSIEQIGKIASYACRPKSRIFNMDRSIEISDVVEALNRAGQMAKSVGV